MDTESYCPDHAARKECFKEHEEECDEQDTSDVVDSVINSVLEGEEEDEALDDEELRELANILRKAKIEGKRRLAQERQMIDNAKNQEMRRRKKEMQVAAFHANSDDFFHLLQGPFYARRVDDGDLTDCFLVSKSCSSKTGEFISCWEGNKLLTHPWNTGTINRSYGVGQLIRKEILIRDLPPGQRAKSEQQARQQAYGLPRRSAAVETSSVPVRVEEPKQTTRTAASVRVVRPVATSFGGFPRIRAPVRSAPPTPRVATATNSAVRRRNINGDEFIVEPVAGEENYEEMY